jgi:hypothetical protein
VQEVGLPPLDLFADVRILVTRAPSYPLFALGVAGAVLVRSVVLAALLGGGSQGSFVAALQFYGAALIPALLSAGFEFSGLAVLYHWYFWIGLAVAILATLAMAPGPWSGSAGSKASRAGRLATVAWYLVALFVLGAAAHAAGKVASVLLVVPSGLLTWMAERRLREGPGPTWRRVAAAVAAVSLVAVLAAVIVRLPGAGPVPIHRPGSLFLVAGVDSATGVGPMFRLDPTTFGYECRQTTYFSYAGTGKGAPHTTAACPVKAGRRYGMKDTQRPLAALIATMREQLNGLRRPVTVVTHSQGAWIAWASLAGGRSLGVMSVIMLAPFPRAPVGYPLSARSGPGRVGGDFLRALSSMGNKLGVATFDPDAALARQLLATPGAAARILSRQLPGNVTALAVQPLWDLALTPEGRALPRAVNACPIRTTHVGVVRSAAAAGMVDRFLAGRPLPSCPPGSGWLSALTAPFGVPPSDT